MLFKDENIKIINILRRGKLSVYNNIEGLVHFLSSINISNFEILSYCDSCHIPKHSTVYLMIDFTNKKENFHVCITHNTYENMHSEMYKKASNELLKMIRNYRLNKLLDNVA